MPNEKVSQLVELGASELALNDLLLVTDTSAHESKKLQASSLLSFVQLTGSFLIINASSASYVPGAGVFGAVTSASFSDTSITSSYSLKVLTPVDTASYALYAEAFGGTISNAFTASYLSYTGFNNGTASFALVSQTANVTSTASHLQYTPGTVNGTASFAISASWAPTSATASLTASYAETVGVAFDPYFFNVTNSFVSLTPSDFKAKVTDTVSSVWKPYTTHHYSIRSYFISASTKYYSAPATCIAYDNSAIGRMVELSWNPVADANGYYIEFSGSDPSSANEFPTGSRDISGNFTRSMADESSSIWVYGVTQSLFPPVTDGWSTPHQHITVKTASFFNPIKAFAWVTWSGVVGKTAPHLMESYNISSFEYIGQILTGSYAIEEYRVIFNNPLSNPHYAFLGNVQGYIYGTYDVGSTAIIADGAHQWYNTGFTCSVAMDTASAAKFFYSGSLTFQILGVP